MMIMAFALNHAAMAQEHSLGTLWSFSGIGLTYEHNVSSEAFAQVSLQTEMADIFLGKAMHPGISAAFTWNLVFAQLESRNGTPLRFYAGPGLTAGTSADSSPGLFFGLKGRVGMQCLFDRRINVSIALAPTLGIHVSRDEENMITQIYRPGLLQIARPEISLSYSLFNKNVNKMTRRKEGISRLSFGAEWSYIGTLHYNTWYNFFSTEGYRISRHENVSGYWNNGEALLHVGYNFNKHWNLALYAGLTGFADIHNAVPVSIRATYCFGQDEQKDRWLTFLDLGSGISIKNEPQEIWTGKIGGGYRITLSRDTKLDFIAAVRLACTHPQIFDEGDLITLRWTNRNLAFLQSFSLGMSITL